MASNRPGAIVNDELSPRQSAGAVLKINVLLPIEWVIFSSFWCLVVDKNLGVIHREVESGEILADTSNMSAARRAKSRSDRSSLWRTPLLYPLKARFGLFPFRKPGSDPQPRRSPAPWGRRAEAMDNSLPAR